MKWTRRLAQRQLTVIGRFVKPSHLRGANAALNYLETGRWFRSRALEGFPKYRTRQALHESVGATARHQKVLYLEFGVYHGDSLRLWSQILAHPEASLHGFDSFQGLPEEWDASRPKGTFDVNGRIPSIPDPRVEFHPGWFSDTLPRFELPAHERLVIHLDADLYSSTAFVLDHLDKWIIPGTILIFDEFCDRLHEQKAFNEYLERTQGSFRVLGSTMNLEQVAFERVR